MSKKRRVTPFVAEVISAGFSDWIGLYNNKRMAHISNELAKVKNDHV